MNKKLFVMFFVVMSICLSVYSLASSVYGKFEYIVIDNEITITGTTEDIVGEIVIPSSIDGYPVTAIGTNAFSFMEELTAVSLPSTLKKMGHYVFIECTALSEVTLPTGLCEMGEGVFEECTSLKKVTLSPSLTAIYRWSFYKCPIETITIPASVKFIEYGAFNDCEMLGDINILADDTVFTYESFNNTKWFNDASNWTSGVLYLDDYLVKAKSTLAVQYAIKPNTKVICGEAFRECTSLPSVILPKGLRSIESGAFTGVPLTDVVIPSTLKKLGDYAFSGCSELSQVIFAEESELETIGRLVFEECTRIKNVTLPDTLQSLGYGAFQKCSSLKSITIPTNVKTVGESAFYQCTALESVNICDGVSYIDRYAFKECSSLKEIALPKSVTHLGWEAFQACTALNSVSLGGIKTIPERAFGGCSSLVSVAIPEGVTAIDTAAFTSCAKLSEVIFPDTIESIGHFAFAATALTEVTLPGNLVTIGTEAFKNCSLLVKITFNDALTTLENTVFDGCDALEEAVFSENSRIENIGTRCFANCDKLKEIYLPATLSYMSGSAFTGCDSLEKIVIHPDNRYYTVDHNYIIYTKDMTKLLFCPSTVEEPEIPSTVTCIGGGAFKSNQKLKSIFLPDSVTDIESSAFAYCLSLEQVTLSANLVNMGDYAFENCTRLKSIVIPESLKKLNICVFYNCSSLTDIVIPESVTSIGMWAIKKTAPARIHGVSGSYAETFSEKNSDSAMYEFVPLSSDATAGGVGLVLDGRIGVKTYFGLYGADSSDVTVRTVVYNNVCPFLPEIQTVTPQYDAEQELYYVVNYVSPSDINNTEVRLYADYGYGYKSLYTATVSEYISAYKKLASDDPSYANALPVVEALETYMLCADAFFGNKGEAISVEADTDAIAALPSPSKSGTAEGIEHVSTSLMLVEDTVIRHYFKLSAGYSADDFSFVCDGEEIIPIIRNGLVAVDVMDIAAHDLDKVYEVTVNGELTVSFSALNYVKATVISDDVALANLSKAIYNYWSRTETYIENL